MTSRILLRRGTAAQWTSANPVLGIGELGIETDTLKIKVGNGSTPWNSITAYANVVPGDLNTTLNGYLETGDLGVTVAELTDGDLYIPENSAIFWNDPAYSYTTTLTATQPTANRIITFPDATGTVALTSDVTSAVTNLINAAPSALDTLNELAAAINNDSSFSTTVNNLLNGKVSKSGGDTIIPSTASTAGLTFTPATGQTANLLQFIGGPSGGGVRVGPGGNVFEAPAIYANYNFQATAGGASVVPVTIKGAASQTANLQEWQNSSGTVLSKIDSSGAMYTITAPANTNTTQVATTAYVQTELNAKLDSSGFTYASITIPVYSAIGDLPSAADNHGRWAHVHGEGAMYFAHGGAWYRALSQTDLYVSTNAQGAGYTVVTSDLGKMIEMSGGGTLTITDSASFPVGFTVNILQTGSSQVTIAGDGFTVNATPGLKLRAQWSSATLVKRALNSWVAMGDLSA